RLHPDPQLPGIIKVSALISHLVLYYSEEQIGVYVRTCVSAKCPECILILTVSMQCAPENVQFRAWVVAAFCWRESVIRRTRCLDTLVVSSAPLLSITVNAP